MSLTSPHGCCVDLPAAFDMAYDPAVALETLISLGFERVLTSGCDSSALEGLPVIKRLIDQVCVTEALETLVAVDQMLISTSKNVFLIFT